jgi:class 3 adenylate cyclase
MRIGLHTGSITAGITGSNIVRYDIYGPDVDIANKMESTETKGRLHISEATMELVELGCPGRFRFDYDKDVLYQPMDRTIKTFFVVPLNPADEID